MLNSVHDLLRSLMWESVAFSVGLRMEREGACLQHGFSVVAGGGSGLDAEVVEHRFRFPSAKQLDSDLVHIATEQRCGTARSERSSGH